ncbi:MAG: GDP-mannose 4,6-dehydratase [Ignavibacteriaceae bacterium]|nr:GDP-mannose 4,6-dehydratase [Ignavibacteriaceae bacterium]
MSNKRAVITGGAGFLGSHLCEKMLENGIDVVCIDNLLTGSVDNISHLFGNDHFSFIKHDVTNFIHVPGNVDYVLHCNVNPIGPRGVYDEAKRFAEAITMAYHRFHGVETRIVRIFNTFGPRMRLNDGRALPAFISQALKGEDITVFGDGSQTRSFCYVSDLVDGIFKLLMSDTSDPVNIGNPEEITIREFAEEVVRFTGSKSKLTFLDLPVDDPKVRQPDITRAKNLLNWEPKVSRNEGLIKALDYFKGAALHS